MRSSSSPVVHPDRPPITRNCHPQRPPLSPLSVELLRVSSPQADAPTWRRLVLEVTARYADTAITDRLRQLVDGGFITDHGTPRTGWLTLKGKAALARALGDS